MQPEGEVHQSLLAKAKCQLCNYLGSIVANSCAVLTDKCYSAVKLASMKSKINLVVSLLAVAVVALGVLVMSDSTKKIVVTHDVIAPSATIGSGLGTVRTFYIPVKVDGVESEGQYLTGTLTTLAEGVGDGQEIRTSNLIFVSGNEENQLVIGGISLYAPAGATLVPGAETTRPIIGGSGIYMGATGEVISTNLGDQGWSHVFYVKMK